MTLLSYFDLNNHVQQPGDRGLSGERGLKADFVQDVSSPPESKEDQPITREIRLPVVTPSPTEQPAAPATPTTQESGAGEFTRFFESPEQESRSSQKPAGAPVVTEKTSRAGHGASTQIFTTTTPTAPQTSE